MLVGEADFASARDNWPRLKRQPLGLAAINKMNDWLLSSLHEVTPLIRSHVTIVTYLSLRDIITLCIPTTTKPNIRTVNLHAYWRIVQNPRQKKHFMNNKDDRNVMPPTYFYGNYIIMICRTELHIFFRKPGTERYILSNKK